MACVRFNGAVLVGPHSASRSSCHQCLIGAIEKAKNTGQFWVGRPHGATLWEEMTCACSVASCERVRGRQPAERQHLPHSHRASTAPELLLTTALPLTPHSFTSLSSLFIGRYAQYVNFWLSISFESLKTVQWHFSKLLN